MKRGNGWIKLLAAVSLISLVFVSGLTGGVALASEIVATDAIKVVAVNTPYAGLEVSLAPGFGVGQWEGGIPVSLEMVSSDDWEGLAVPGDCGDHTFFRFLNRVAKPEKVLETKVYPVEELFQGIRESVLYRLVEPEGEASFWEGVEGWPREEPEDLVWSFHFGGETEVTFLLCGVAQPEVPDPALSGTDWQLFWTETDEKWWQSDAPTLTFDEGNENDPGALYFTLTSFGDWGTIGSLDLFLYFEADPSGGHCLFHRIGADGEWIPWVLADLVELRPAEGEDEGWLGEYGFRIHMILPNERVESLSSLNDIQFRLGSCVIPVVAEGTFEGGSPLWKLVYKACSEEGGSVDLLPYTYQMGDLEGLSETEQALLADVIDSLFFFSLNREGCIETLEATFWFECGALAEGERYYLWALDAEGGAAVLMAVPEELTEWVLLDPAVESGGLTFCSRFGVDLSEFAFDGDTLFVLAPLSPEDLEPGGGDEPGGGGSGEGGGGGGCFVSGFGPLILLLVPLGLSFRR